MDFRISQHSTYKTHKICLKMYKNSISIFRMRTNLLDSRYKIYLYTRGPRKTKVICDPERFRFQEGVCIWVDLFRLTTRKTHPRRFPPRPAPLPSLDQATKETKQRGSKIRASGSGQYTKEPSARSKKAIHTAPPGRSAWATRTGRGESVEAAGVCISNKVSE